METNTQHDINLLGFFFIDDNLPTDLENSQMLWCIIH
jgi:hypothetical protein